MRRNEISQHMRRQSFHLLCHHTEGDQTRADSPAKGSQIVVPHSYHSSPHQEYVFKKKSKELFAQVTN